MILPFPNAIRPDHVIIVFECYTFCKATKRIGNLDRAFFTQTYVFFLFTQNMYILCSCIMLHCYKVKKR